MALEACDYLTVYNSLAPLYAFASAATAQRETANNSIPTHATSSIRLSYLEDTLPTRFLTSCVVPGPYPKAKQRPSYGFSWSQLLIPIYLETELLYSAYCVSTQCKTHE